MASSILLLEQDAKTGRPLPGAEAYELAATRFALRRVRADARTDDACVEIAEAVFDALSR